MEPTAKKRLGTRAALLFLSPALIGTLSGCGGSGNCDDDRSTLTTSDDCGTGRRGSSSSYRARGGSGGGSFGSGVEAPRSGGFGGFGRFFSGGS